MNKDTKSERNSQLGKQRVKNCYECEKRFKTDSEWIKTHKRTKNALKQIKDYKLDLDTLSEYEGATVWDYSKLGYAGLNRRLRTGEKLSPFDLAYMRMLNAAIDKLPKIPKGSALYRGTSLSDDIIAQYEVGGIITEKSFTSSSLNFDTAMKFAKTDNSNNRSVIFDIRGKSGASIDHLSHWHVVKKQSENEYLFKASTKFIVTSSYEYDDKLIIELLEI